eukprot:scaffold27177_cov14-Tisochrysis_lutea.AAC.1
MHQREALDASNLELHTFVCAQHSFPTIHHTSREQSVCTGKQGDVSTSTQEQNVPLLGGSTPVNWQSARQ